MTKELRVLVVDDEVHARRGLRTLLGEEPDVNVVGECKDGSEAVTAIRELKPDLVFLDIEMPELDGLQVVSEVGPDAMPVVVFVTAYDQYAVAAFDVSAVDYLLKPFTDERFQTAMQRVRETLARAAPGAMGEQYRQVIAATNGTASWLDRFTVKDGKTLKVFRADDIDWIEADEYYCRLHIGDGVHLIRQPISMFDERLPPQRFARIHRSTIVNMDRIAALEPLQQGDCIVILHDGTRLRMGRRRRDALADLLSSFS